MLDKTAWFQEEVQEAWGVGEDEFAFTSGALGGGEEFA